ncbi:MAG TPA: hypothetical protein PLU22_19495 [Polyangiaceae bacterium]|nr:hypothetical protein [Polyangiaceae bacterium]
MRNAVLVLAVAGMVLTPALTGCKKKQQQPPPAYGQPAYGQPAATAYGAPPPATAATPPPAVAPAATPTLSTPGPAALPCTSDATCLTAKCHPTVQKCIFPCATNDDCIAPNICIVGTGVCAPNLGAAAPAP